MVARSSKECCVISSCPICSTREIVAIDNRPRVPIVQNRVWPERSAAREAPVGALDMVLCAACGFAWNRAFDADRMIYDPEYDNDQTGSPTFSAHADAMIKRVLESVQREAETHLIEVGCGHGAFLGKVYLAN